MCTHRAVWAAIDTLGRRRKLSLPKLALSAGLDQTALNPSKRKEPDGKPRWPSTETLQKVLRACGTSLSEFSELVESIALAEQKQPNRDLHP